MPNSTKVLNPEADPFHWAAVELRNLRGERGLTIADVAKVIGKTSSLISKVENGVTPLQLKDADKIDKACETGGTLGRIIRIAKSRHSSQWSEEVDAIAAEATQAHIWSLGWVPALLQTPEYARAMFQAAQRADVEQAVQRRIRLQESVLGRTPAPIVRAIIDEGALMLPVGSPEVTLGQLDHLIVMTETVTIRLVELSAGAHIGRDGSFVVYTGPDGRDHPFTSTLGPGRLVGDPGEVATYRVALDRISDIALNVGESLDRLRRMREHANGQVA
ncbi:helix-turn-helix domain-containing protein [Actinomadura oligospora]|uniref:helix-turn-helix domain-containing protein n=1 Tax=Actinomadura oligospora TaxID=111804 RepID=UPI00047ACB0B|nr:helix-turn-helix transcriptional regulator [Actinomadura oligospora]